MPNAIFAKLRRCCTLLRQATLLTVLAVPTSWAAELVVNGSFESHAGSGATLFDGWTITTQAAGQGGFYAQTGTVSPTNNLEVAAPPLGSGAAMSDQSGPSSQVLYQDITLPAGIPALLSLRLLVSNQSDDFVSPATLDYSTAQPNQQARIDIMSPAAPPFDLGPGVLRNLYQTQPGDARSAAYTPLSWDVSAFAGQTVRLRVAQADNLHGLNLGIDGVSLQTAATVSTPTSYTSASPTGTGLISSTLVGSAGCAFDSSSYTAAPPPAGAPPGVWFPHGFFVFKTVGCTVGAPITMTVHYPSPLPAGTQYWKFGPTTADPTGHWYVVPSTVAGNSISFTIVDGGLGDDDLLANGSITDLGGAGAPGSAPVVTPVPTLSPMGLLTLSLAMLVFGAWRRRRV